MTERYLSIVDVHVILRREGTILLLRRAGNVYATGMLCLPSGHLEDGESVLSAAVRETKEETGIALEPAALRLVLSIHERHPGTTQRPRVPGRRGCLAAQAAGRRPRAHRP